MLFLVAAWVPLGEGKEQPKEKSEDVAGFKEFTNRVNEYMKLHEASEKELPAQKNKEALPEMITAHQEALARKIREKRPKAKPGDIFTKGSREAFRHVIHSVFRNPQTGGATTAKQSADKQRRTAKPVALQVNGNYPNADAETTFPPALLQRLPPLPEDLAYRIVGRDLVLVDWKANMVIDILHKVIP
jgi:hypothetical protein